MMTHKERMLNALSRKSVDELPHGDGLWGETHQKYLEQGKLQKDEDVCTHFDMSWRGGGWLNSTADLDFQDQLLEETEETKLVINGNGATLRWFKAKSGTPEHVDFKVKEKKKEETLKDKLASKIEGKKLTAEHEKDEKAKPESSEKAPEDAGSEK